MTSGRRNLRDFGFPGVSLEKGPLTGPLFTGHLDAIVTELVSCCCCTALLLSDPVNKWQKISQKKTSSRTESVTLCSMRKNLDKKHVKKSLLFTLDTVDQLTGCMFRNLNFS